MSEPATALSIALSIALGIGLAAAVGFRVFVPLLVASIAADTGHLHLADSFAWLGSPTALTMFAVAAVVEVMAYYLPGIDNVLDSLTTPLAKLRRQGRRQQVRQPVQERVQVASPRRRPGGCPSRTDRPDPAARSRWR
jgi:hypothetical protein